MARKLDYHWHLRQVLADRGMFATTDLIEPLARRGIALSSSQVYRLVVERPERLIPYRGWLVKGSAAGRWYGPAPRASRALRVPAGPAAPALDRRVPAGPGQGKLRAGRCPAR